MRDEIVELLKCPSSGSPLKIASVSDRDGDDILEGVLETSETETPIRYEISHGVPSFISTLKDGDQRQSISTFGAEWQRYAYWGWIEEVPEGEDPLQYIGGLLSYSPMFFKLKTQIEHITLPENAWAIDCGCGNGRHSFQAREAGIPNIISMDASEAAYVARKNFVDRGIRDITVIRGNVLNMPLRDSLFDLAFTIGVMQHTGDGLGLLKEMARVTKPKAAVSVNCYGTGTLFYEVFDFLMRAVTTRLPRRQQESVAAAMSALGRWVWKGKEEGFRKFLFQNINIMPTDHHMFDWYSPRLAAHYSPRQLLKMFDEVGLDPKAGHAEIWKKDYDDTFRRQNHQAFAIYLQNMKS